MASATAKVRAADLVRRLLDKGFLREGLFAGRAVRELIDGLTHRQLVELHSIDALNYRVYGDRRKTVDLRRSLRMYVERFPDTIPQMMAALGLAEEPMAVCDHCQDSGAVNMGGVERDCPQCSD